MPSALRAEWEDLLSRRPSFRPTLALYEPVIATWEQFDPSFITPLAWSAEACREVWGRSVALLAEASLALDPESLDPLVGSAVETLSRLGDEEAEAMGRLAQAWEAGRLQPGALLTGVGEKAQGSLSEELGLTSDLLGFVAAIVLRPPLESYLSRARQAFKDEYWDSGHCPFCGSPPAWGDIQEDGKRWLCCALCGGSWTIGRIRCPFCDNRNAKTLTRLAAEGGEEGYLIEACDLCFGYLKGVDRRVRWNAASPLVEDWGTPHLDLIALRRGYWRAVPSLVQLARPEAG